jgi:hypothetical protein
MALDAKLACRIRVADRKGSPLCRLLGPRDDDYRISRAEVKFGQHTLADWNISEEFACDVWRKYLCSLGAWEWPSRMMKIFSGTAKISHVEFCRSSRCSAVYIMNRKNVLLSLTHIEVLLLCFHSFNQIFKLELQLSRILGRRTVALKKHASLIERLIINLLSSILRQVSVHKSSKEWKCENERRC